MHIILTISGVAHYQMFDNYYGTIIISKNNQHTTAIFDHLENTLLL